MLNEIDYTSEFPEITEETTIEELQAIHKRIWQYVVDHGKKPRTPYVANCVACHWVYTKCGTIYCKYCPIKWPCGGRCSSGRLGLYSRWSMEKRPWQRDVLALCIRDIKFKEVSECQK